MSNSEEFHPVKGGVLAAKGFQSAGLSCGIKRSKGTKDIGLLVASKPAVAGATLTTNHVKAAPVRWCGKVLRKNKSIRAIIVNSGIANACTGKQGDKDTEDMAHQVANLLGCESSQVLVSSTGLIGEFLPMDRIHKGVNRVFKSLNSGPASAKKFAESILTTDSRPKQIAVRVECQGKTFSIGGCAKGAGMIGPRMATMLAYITTDAAIDATMLRRYLKKAVESSFNSISIDGHTSTNDTAVLLSSGLSGVRIDDKISRAKFQAALNYVSLELAKEIVKDGEGATKLVRFRVLGAESMSDAKTIARAMANSPLNLTAIHGCDPNWGRFISSAGYAGPKLVDSKSRLFINGLPVYIDGVPANTPQEELARTMQDDEIYLQLELGLGKGSADMWACDLSEEYITINADYHT